MPSFGVIKLGKDSVPAIQQIDSLHSAPANPIELTIKCSQVPTEAISGIYVFLCLGSDNNKGVKTSWLQGIRAFGTISRKTGGPKYNDEWNVDVSIQVILSHSVTRKDLLREAATAYYWCCNVPHIGIEAGFVA
jgi:hypothetical protein